MSDSENTTITDDVTHSTTAETSKEATVDVPPKCLSFRIQSDWGHFRRSTGNNVKQTHRVPPKTTVAGMIAATLGLDRDSYYDAFQAHNSAIATTIESTPRTINMPINSLSTDYSSLKKVNSQGGGPKLSIPNSEKARQQYNFEVLVDPVYTIDVWVDNTELYNELRSKLENGESYYNLSMGKSEYIAEREYLGEFSPEKQPDGVHTVDSTAPNHVTDVVPQPDVKTHTEQVSAHFEMRTDTVSGQPRRHTEEYIDVAYTPEAELKVKTNVAAEVGDRTVIFY